MFANSPQIQSAQSGPHPRLREIVRKHLAVGYQRQPSEAGRKAFADVADRLAQAPFILDAGCGTGASTFALAHDFPQHLVLGVDKSAARLAIGQRVVDRGLAPANALLLHCELVDFWQLALAAGLHCERQYLLYPNPWPKAEQVKRRWHAHPILPAILASGAEIELRTNWCVYAEEFAIAMQIAGVEAKMVPFTSASSLTPFEHKYAASGHALWRVTARR